MLSALLGAWEEVKAAEEARAQQEAELFKNKTQTSTFQTEEVLATRLCSIHIGAATVSWRLRAVHQGPAPDASLLFRNCAYNKSPCLLIAPLCGGGMLRVDGIVFSGCATRDD